VVKVNDSYYFIRNEDHDDNPITPSINTLSSLYDGYNLPIAVMVEA
jgi:hypothetical protein